MNKTDFAIRYPFVSSFKILPPRLPRASCHLALVLSLLTSTALGATLRAGVAKVDITPPPGVRMWGYGNRKGPATGVLDPLYSRVLVLAAGDKKLALVALDLGRPFGPASLARLRDAAQKSSGISYLLVVASHTHSGPVVQDEYPAGATPAWETSALEKISKAIDEAAANLVEARLGVGTGVTYIGHNRLRENPDGTVSWFERNPTRVPTAPVDPTVLVLRVDNAEGKPLAILVNYSCHPVVFGPDNLQYSADYPAVMTQTVERALAADGQPLCIFLQGAPGDINPYYAVTPLEQDAVKMRDWTGERLGREAARVAKGIKTEAAPDASIDYAEDLLDFHLRWDAEKFRQGLIAAFGPRVFEDFGSRITTEMKLPVTTVLINKRIAMMGMPGEPFVDFQRNWRDRCPVSHAFFLGYANGYYGYFPTIRAASMGGYGAASSSTWVQVGAGERMVDHALTTIYKMLGRFSDSPEDLKKK
ncbi:MAG: neutral/alkaline non-lysosomal ceramidase N-terminal domain-containing protein [Terriglobia bacterium]